MNKLLAIVMMGTALVPMNASAVEAYPLSAELIAAQSDLDVLRTFGKRDQMDKAMQRQIDAAINRRNAELDKRAAEWKKLDGGKSMFKAQFEVCNAIRENADDSVKEFEKLQYAGFSVQETLSIVLHIKYRTPTVGDSAQVAVCILGIPADTIRTETKYSRRLMLVYPEMFVHLEDGKVTAWSER